MNRFLSLIIFLCSISAIQARDVSGRVTCESADSAKFDVDSISLGEVTVSANVNSHSAMVDRVMVTAKMREGTHYAAELLGRMQGLIYNPVSQSVSVLGSSNVKILVDSVERNENVIKLMNPSRFGYISVTHNPMGKYSGYDAVINFHTKPTYRGYEGMVRGTEGILPGKGNGKGRNQAMEQGLASIGYTHEKLTLTASANYHSTRSAAWNFFSRRYTHNNLAEKTRETSSDTPTTYNWGNDLQTEVGADYQINKNHSVSLLWKGEWPGNKSRSQWTLDRTTLDGQPLESYDYRKNFRWDDYYINTLGLYYTGRFSHGWDMYAWLTQNHMEYNEFSHEQRGVTPPVSDENNTKVNDWWAGTTVNFAPGNQKWKFSLDEKINVTSTTSRSLIDEAQHSKSTDFRNTTMASAMYMPTPRIAVTAAAGVNMLHSSQTGASWTDVKPAAKLYAFWYPSQKFIVRGTYDLTYSSVPLMYMRDYGAFTDSLSYYHGNPALRPALTHRVSVTAYMLECLTVSLGYVDRMRAIWQIRDVGFGVRPDGLEGPFSASTFENGNAKMFSGTLNFNKQFGSHWMVMGSISATFFRASQSHYMNKGWDFPFTAMATYQLPRQGFNVSLLYEYQPSSELAPQTDIFKETDEWTLQMQKYFLPGGKLGVGLTYYIPLHFIRGKRSGGIIAPGYEERVWSRNLYRLNNYISLSLSYRFNGGNEVKKYKRVTTGIQLTQ